MLVSSKWKKRAYEQLERADELERSYNELLSFAECNHTLKLILKLRTEKLIAGVSPNKVSMNIDDLRQLNIELRNNDILLGLDYGVKSVFGLDVVVSNRGEPIKVF